MRDANQQAVFVNYETPYKFEVITRKKIEQCLARNYIHIPGFTIKYQSLKFLETLGTYMRLLI